MVLYGCVKVILNITESKLGQKNLYSRCVFINIKKIPTYRVDEETFVNTTTVVSKIGFAGSFFEEHYLGFLPAQTRYMLFHLQANRPILFYVL